MVIDHLNEGGAQKFLIRLCDELVRRKFKVIVCSLQPLNRDIRNSDPKGWETICLSTRRFNLRGFFLLIRLMRAVKPDVLHTHLTASNILGVAAGKISGIPKIFTHDHSGEYYPYRLPRIAKLSLMAIERLMLSFVQSLFAVSNSVAEFNRHKKKVPSEKVTVLPNWVEPTELRHGTFEMDMVRARYRIPKSSIVIGAAGRLSPEKGHLVLLESFAELMKRWPNCRLLIAGGGPIHQELLNRVDMLGATSNIFLLGDLKNMHDFYSAVDIFVQPSRYETFGIAVLEAMHLGLPVIASNVGGLPELIKHEKTGLLVDPESPEALLQALERLLKDQALRERLGKSGCSFVQKHYDGKRCVEQLIEHYLH